MQAIIKGLEKVKQELAASEDDGPISEVFRKVENSSYLKSGNDFVELVIVIIFASITFSPSIENFYLLTMFRLWKDS